MNLQNTNTVILFKPKTQFTHFFDTYRHYISILDEDTCATASTGCII